MRIIYDAQVDAMSIIFRETTVTTQEVASGVVVEYDGEGRMAGIEILDAVKRFGDESTLRKITFEGLVPTAPVR